MFRCVGKATRFFKILSLVTNLWCAVGRKSDPVFQDFVSKSIYFSDKMSNINNIIYLCGGVCPNVRQFTQNSRNSQKGLPCGTSCNVHLSQGDESFVQFVFNRNQNNFYP